MPGGYKGLLLATFRVACVQTITKLWLVPSAKQRRDPCSGPPNGLNELPEVRFEFPFNLIGDHDKQNKGLF